MGAIENARPARSARDFGPGIAQACLGSFSPSLLFLYPPPQRWLHGAFSQR
jgi:hypothetical protein